jgi:predicted negative regulator of RcsB-dependent stress response
MKRRNIYLVVILIIILVLGIFYYKSYQTRLKTEELTPKEYIQNN